jgi:LysM repeat protein
LHQSLFAYIGGTEMKQRLFILATLLFMLSWLLVACERPLQPALDSDTAPPAVTVEDVDTPAEAATAVPEAAPEAPAEAMTPIPVEEAEPVDESPRPEAEVEEEAVETEEVAEEAADPAEEATEAETEEAAAEESEEAETAAEETTAEETAQAAAMPETHTVAAGENLYRIGLKYGVSWVALAQLNNLTNPNSIVVGQVLRLPGSNGAAPTPTPSPFVETTYIVRPGDNLYRIGQAYGIGWVQIAEANGLVNPNQIYVGQALKIPVSAPGPTPQFTHVVQRGETLFLISLRYGIPWPTIAQANEIGSPYVIYVGQTLVIPGGGN